MKEYTKQELEEQRVIRAELDKSEPRELPNPQILTARPETMTYEEYKFLRSYQTKILKKLFRKAPIKNIPMPVRIGYNFHPKLY